MDNYGTHRAPLTHRWLVRHPRFHVHFTPTSSTWLNLAERFFAAIAESKSGWRRELAEAADRMLGGSLVAVYRKCGKPTCHCATGEKHGPVWYLSRRKEGRTRMRFIGPAQLEIVTQGVTAFQRYRALGQRLAAENLAGLPQEHPRARRAR